MLSAIAKKKILGFLVYFLFLANSEIRLWLVSSACPFLWPGELSYFYSQLSPKLPYKLLQNGTDLILVEALQILH